MAGTGIDSATEQPDLSEGSEMSLHLNMQNAKFGDINMRNAEFGAIDIAGTHFHCTSAGIGDRERIPLRFGPNYHISNSMFSECDLDGIKIEKSNRKNAKIEGSQLEGMTIDGILVTEMLALYKELKSKDNDNTQNT